MIEAGSETTSMQLNNMILGILSNPGALGRAHEELDRVVGSDRPPDFHDEPNLPYIRSIIKVTPSSHFLTSGSYAMASHQQIWTKSLRNAR
jgi:hypothetical protein